MFFHLSVKMGCEVVRCCALIIVHWCVIYDCHPLTRTVKAKQFEALLDSTVNPSPWKQCQRRYILATCPSRCLLSFLTNQVI